VTFLVSFLFMLFHDGARSHFFRATAVASLFLGGLLDVLVLALPFSLTPLKCFFSGMIHLHCLVLPGDQRAVAFAYTYLYQPFGLRVTLR
jgi:hypothetical protein